MDKRAFLKTVLGKKESPSKHKMSLATPLANNPLDPYTGEWTVAHANHLCSRALFGATVGDIKAASEQGLDSTLDRLFRDMPMPDPPIYFNFDGDPQVPNGQTWVNHGSTSGIDQLQNRRRQSLRAWHQGLFQNSDFHIREKMVLFWHEHIPIANIRRALAEYYYMDIFRRHALGNFRTLMEEITINPAMLFYLNGFENSKESPNENYARELLELFTIGRGEAVGEGDYTHYTEDDVVALARALTGWRFQLDDRGVPIPLFVPFSHDRDDKKLSHRFENQVISTSGDGSEEYKEVIDIILKKEEVSKFLCRKLHIWFVGSTITPDIEANIIAPMASIIREDNYEIERALKTLLRSNYFNDEARRGCMISSPLDFMYKLINGFELYQADDMIDRYPLWSVLYGFATNLDMQIYEMPTVAGWKAYYQTPQYYEFWINAVSLNRRDDFVEALVSGYRLRGVTYRFDTLSFISKLENPYDPEPMIREITSLLLVTPISQNQLDYLKEILIPGLPDFEWTVEYSDYLNNPNDMNIKTSVETKLGKLFGAIMKMPEFYLM